MYTKRRFSDLPKLERPLGSDFLAANTASRFRCPRLIDGKDPDADTGDRFAFEIQYAASDGNIVNQFEDRSLGRIDVQPLSPLKSETGQRGGNHRHPPIAAESTRKWEPGVGNLERAVGSALCRRERAFRDIEPEHGTKDPDRSPGRRPALWREDLAADSDKVAVDLFGRQTPDRF